MTLGKRFNTTMGQKIHQAAPTEKSGQHGTQKNLWGETKTKAKLGRGPWVFREASLKRNTKEGKPL